MLELVLGLVLVVALYARTFEYRRLIDDAVPMSGYLYDVPESAPAPSFFLEKSPWQHRALAIGCHMMNVWLVYLILGGKAALLFAVYPVAVNNVAWITGSYYACTTMLTLIAYYFLTHTVWWIGAPVACFAFAAALNTTLAAVAFPLVFLFGNPIGLVTVLPLIGFLVGKRFRTGVKIREKFGKFDKMAPDTFSVGRIAFSIKLLALYLYTALVPMKLLFFREFGARYRVNPEVKKDMDSFGRLFWMSVGLIGAFLVLGFVTGKLFWALWFLIFMLAFCQIRMLGQVFAERYMYPACVGIVAILAQLPDPAYWAIVGLYVMRTHMFIPVFQTNKALYENGINLDGEPSNYCNISDWYLMVERDLTLAGYYIQQNIKLDPMDYKPYVNFSSMWRLLAQPRLALDNLIKAKELAQGFAGVRIMEIIEQQKTSVEAELDAKKT